MTAHQTRAGGTHLARERGAYLDEPKPPRRKPASWHPFVEFFKKRAERLQVKSQTAQSAS